MTRRTQYPRELCVTRRAFLAQAAMASLVTSATSAQDAQAHSKTGIQTSPVPQTDLIVSRIAYGCSRLAGWRKEPPSVETLNKAERVIRTVCDQGINFFDLADGYGFGHAEAAFGEIIRRSPGLRERIVIQSKCGVRGKNSPLPLDSFAMDLSREHIVASVEGSLRRLRTDRLDLLLLHGPDALARPEEVAQGFDELKRSGKVRYFGVSNHTPGQIELLKQSVREPLVANQIPLGLPRPKLIADDLLRDTIVSTGTLDYCRRNAIQVQAFSPLRGDLLNAADNAAPEVQRMKQLLTDLAQRKNTNPSAVALAWLLHHPAGIVPIIGSTRPQWIVENCAADGVTLNRSEWYALLQLAQALPPQRGLTPGNDD